MCVSGSSRQSPKTELLGKNELTDMCLQVLTQMKIESKSINHSEKTRATRYTLSPAVQHHARLRIRPAGDKHTHTHSVDGFTAVGANG